MQGNSELYFTTGFEIMDTMVVKSDRLRWMPFPQLQCTFYNSFNINFIFLMFFVFFRVARLLRRDTCAGTCADDTCAATVALQNK